MISFVVAHENRPSINFPFLPYSIVNEHPFAGSQARLGWRQRSSLPLPKLAYYLNSSILTFIFLYSSQLFSISACCFS